MKSTDLLKWRNGHLKTPTQMANYLGIDISTYKRWEEGERQWPKVASRLFEVLKMIEILNPDLAKSLQRNKGDS